MKEKASPPIIGKNEKTTTFFRPAGRSPKSLKQPHPEPEDLAQRRRSAKAFSTWPRGWVGSMPLIHAIFWEGNFGEIRFLRTREVAENSSDISAFLAHPIPPLSDLCASTPLREASPSGRQAGTNMQRAGRSGWARVRGPYLRSWGARYCTGCGTDNRSGD